MATTLVAYFTLGPAAHTIKPEAKNLVTKGIYSKIRHPIYFFSMLSWIGFALLMRSPGLLLVCFFILGIQAIRATKEEKLLEEKFGQQYKDYKKGTWF